VRGDDKRDGEVGGRNERTRHTTECVQHESRVSSHGIRSTLGTFGESHSLRRGTAPTAAANTLYSGSVDSQAVASRADGCVMKHFYPS
jgi:hypothetical protein